MQLLSAIRQQRRARCDIALAVVWFALSTKALEGSSLRGGQRESPKLFPSQRPCWEPSQPMAVVSSHASPTSVIDTVARPVRVLASHWPAFCPPPPLSCSHKRRNFASGIKHCGRVERKCCVATDSRPPGECTQHRTKTCMFRMMSHGAAARRATTVVITSQRASTLCAAAKTFYLSVDGGM